MFRRAASPKSASTDAGWTEQKTIAVVVPA
jgi:hypothetical protein